MNSLEEGEKEKCRERKRCCCQVCESFLGVGQLLNNAKLEESCYLCVIKDLRKEGQETFLHSLMSRLLKRGKQEKPLVSDGAEKVIVAVKASREIPKTALIWALTHVAQPGDCITLIVVVPSQNSGTFSCLGLSLFGCFVFSVYSSLILFSDECVGRKLWGFTRSFPMFAGDCASGHRKPHSEALPAIKSDLTDTCSQMILQLHDVYDPNKVFALIAYMFSSHESVTSFSYLFVMVVYGYYR